MTNEEFDKVSNALSGESLRALEYLSTRSWVDGRRMAYDLASPKSKLGQVRERGEEFDQAKCVTGLVIAKNWMVRPLRSGLVRIDGTDYRLSGLGYGYLAERSARKRAEVLRHERETADANRRLASRRSHDWWEGFTAGVISSVSIAAFVAIVIGVYYGFFR